MPAASVSASCSASASSDGRSVSSPASDALNSTTFCSPMPAMKSMPWAPYGAMPAMLTTPAVRCGSSAPIASACGPPPDHPTVTQRSAPSASSSASMSGVTSATDRPALRLDPPYPARE